MVFFERLQKRLHAHHSGLEKTIFGVSLLGVLTVTHLYIQQALNFDQGCLGFSGLETSQMAFDCSAVVTSGAGTFLGLSNITWGLGFYLFVATLTFGLFRVRSGWRHWMHGGRLAGLFAGVLYSAYLVYVQVGVIGALCALCLFSAALVLLLFGVQVAALSIDDQSTASTMTSRLFKRDLTFYVYLVAFTAVIAGADLTYFNALPQATDERAQTQTEQFGGAACQLDPKKEPVENNGTPLVGFQDITKGPSDASVTIIEYFDPNCPHCKDFHETMKTLVSTFEDQVRFVFKPFPLRGSSLPEIQALYLAHQQGKFSEMLDAQYARQSRSGISKQDLRAIASEIGMSPDALLSKIQQNEFREAIIQQHKRGMKVGVDSTPTVLVNGHFVGSRSLECMKRFIEQAQNGTLGEAASSS